MDDDDIFVPSLVTKRVSVPMEEFNNNIADTKPVTLLQRLRLDFEGKCGVGGFMRPGSCEIVNASAGLVRGANVIFNVKFQCQLFSAHEGMTLRCRATNITQAGIRAVSALATGGGGGGAKSGASGDGSTPFVLFVARTHDAELSERLDEVGAGDLFIARVVAQRFELNAPFVSIIGEFVHLLSRK